MSILDRLQRQPQGYPKHATFRLTESGRDKLQDYTGDPQSSMLVALETRGSCTAQEIADASRLNCGQVERLLPRLVRGGFIQPVSALSSDVF